MYQQINTWNGTSKHTCVSAILGSCLYVARCCGHILRHPLTSSSTAGWCQAGMNKVHPIPELAELPGWHRLLSGMWSGQIVELPKREGGRWSGGQAWAWEGSQEAGRE